MANSNFNLRGMLIAPQDKSQISYYLCLMDVPAGITTNNFTPINANPAYVTNPLKPETTCFYSCDLNLADYEGLPATQTIALPIYAYSPYMPKTEIQITDYMDNTVTGDPNKGVPPKVDMPANPNNNYTTSNITVQSESSGLNGYYFIIVITSSKGISVDVSNYFAAMTLDSGNLLCTLQTNGGASTYQAPIGVYPSIIYEIETTQVVGGNPPTLVDWDPNDTYHL